MKRGFQTIVSLFFGGMLLVLGGCQTIPEPKVNLSEVVYFEGNPYALDVAEVLVVQESKAFPVIENSANLFEDIHPVLENWFAKSFIARGKKGKALIHIKNVNVTQQHILGASQIHSLLNTKGPSRYGANVIITIEVLDTDKYKKAESTTKIYREVTITSDINVSFHQSLWVTFVRKFMKELDRQLLLDIKKNMPQLLKENSDS